MAESRECLEWTAMSRTLNRVKAPNNFVLNTLYPDSTIDLLSTEKVELGTLVADREMAPFVKKNGQSIMVPGENSAPPAPVAAECATKLPSSSGSRTIDWSVTEPS